MSAQTDRIKADILDRIEEYNQKLRPSYNIDGQDIQWNEYIKDLYAQLRAISTTAAPPVYEIRSRYCPGSRAR